MDGQNALSGNVSILMVEVTPNASAGTWDAAPRWPTKHSRSQLLCDPYSWASSCYDPRPTAYHNQASGWSSGGNGGKGVKCQIEGTPT